MYPVDFIDRLLILSSGEVDDVSKGLGFYAGHPMLAVGRNWQAAVTVPAACYLQAAPAPELVARISPTPGMRYAATVIRGTPRYPGALAVFNSKVPLILVRLWPLQLAWLSLNWHGEYTVPTSTRQNQPRR